MVIEIHICFVGYWGHPSINESFEDESPTAKTNTLSHAIKAVNLAWIPVVRTSGFFFAFNLIDVRYAFFWHYWCVMSIKGRALIFYFEPTEGRIWAFLKMCDGALLNGCNIIKQKSSMVLITNSMSALYTEESILMVAPCYFFKKMCGMSVNHFIFSEKCHKYSVKTIGATVRIQT